MGQHLYLQERGCNRTLCWLQVCERVVLLSYPFQMLPLGPRRSSQVAAKCSGNRVTSLQGTDLHLSQCLARYCPNMSNSHRASDPLTSAQQFHKAADWGKRQRVPQPKVSREAEEEKNGPQQDTHHQSGCQSRSLSLLLLFGKNRAALIILSAWATVKVHVWVTWLSAKRVTC